MLALLRFVFGFALFAVFAKALRVSGSAVPTEGTADAGYLALAVIVGIANAVVWAPLVGRLMADPLTGAFTTGQVGDDRNGLLQFAHRLAFRGWRRAALFFAFLEGVRHPDRPSAFVLGLNHARSGGWLERAFAREVWRFSNAENCLRAWKVLRARGIDPGLHKGAEVNLLILSVQREKRPDALVLEVPPAPPPPPPLRDQRIRLFDGAPGEEAAGGATVGNREFLAPAPDGQSDTRKDGGPSRDCDCGIAVGGRGADGAAPSIGATGLTEDSLKQAPVSRPGEPRRLSWRERWQVLWTGRVPE